MKLKDIIRIDNPAEYRLHFAKDSSKFGGTHPLDVYLASFKAWVAWHRYPAHDGANRFPVRYVLSFIDFYHQPDSSLFGGIFEVTGRHWENLENNPSEFYDIKLVEDYSYLIGGILVQTPYTGMATVVTLDGRYDNIDVCEILPKPYKSTQGMR